MARGQGGDRLHRRKWRGAPRRGRSAGALPRRRLLKREEQSEGASEWVWGRRNSPCPRYNPQPAPHSGSTALEGGSTAGSGSTALEGGSTASATTLLLDQRLTLKKKRKAKPKEREDRRGNTHTQQTRNNSNTNNHTKQSKLWPLSGEGGGRSHLCLSQLVWHREELSLGP